MVNDGLYLVFILGGSIWPIYALNIFIYIYTYNIPYYLTTYIFMTKLNNLSIFFY